MDRAVAAAADKDVQVSGGVSTIRHYLEAGLIDELNLAISPRLLGSGEHLLHGIDLKLLGYSCTSHRASDAAMHLTLTRAP
jgi:dihydrofolate reductase